MNNPIRSIGEFLDQILPANRGTYTAPTTYRVRDQLLTDQDLDTARKVMFGEISNRNPAKQSMEAALILNTALNRIPQYKAQGRDMTLHQVLSEPKQYQAYGGQEYKRLEMGSTTPVDAQKLKAIDDVLNNVRAGNGLADTTKNRVFYSHDPQGQIWLKDGSLFKQPRTFVNLNQ